MKQEGAVKISMECLRIPDCNKVLVWFMDVIMSSPVDTWRESPLDNMSLLE